MAASSPAHSHLYLVEGLYEASLLIAYQNLGIKVAHRFLLNDTPFNPDESSAPSARRYNAAIISNGIDDKFVATPVGLAIGVMSKLAGKIQVKTEIKNNPAIDLVNTNAVTNIVTEAAVNSGTFTYVFPAHSITRISLKSE